METGITRRQLVKIIQASGVTITLSNTAVAENGAQNTTSTLTTMPDKHGPQRTGKFVVEFDDDKVAGWKTVTIPAVSIEQGTYREKEEDGEENGEEIPDPYRRQVKFEGGEDKLLEMERGVKIGDTTIFDWGKAIAEEKEERKKRVAVTLMDRSGEPVVKWEFEGAIGEVFYPPRLDASADGDTMTESITITFDKMIRSEV